MSSVQCQGLQTCLEPRLLKPRVLSHKLTPPRSKTLAQSLLAHKKEEEENGGCGTKISDNGEVGGWSFLQAIANTPHICRESIEQDQKPYVHPLVKRSSSILSKESLEICTESLGSETGSEISESSEEFSWRVQRSPEPREFSIRRRTRGCDGGALPPPLTSAGGVRLKTHREGDRLVVEAVAIARQSSCFKAERGDGRLRLCLVEENSGDCEKDKEVIEEHEFGGGEEEAEEEDEVGEEGGRGGYYGKFGNVGGEKEIGELCRPSRCKERAKGCQGLVHFLRLCVEEVA